MNEFEIETVINNKLIVCKIKYIKYALVELYKKILINTNNEIPYLAHIISQIIEQKCDFSNEDIDILFNKDIEKLIKENNQYEYLYEFRLLVNIKKIYEEDIMQLKIG